jgi:hypothetical protein
VLVPARGPGLLRLVRAAPPARARLGARRLARPVLLRRDAARPVLEQPVGVWQHAERPVLPVVLLPVVLLPVVLPPVVLLPVVLLLPVRHVALPRIGRTLRR